MFYIKYLIGTFCIVNKTFLSVNASQYNDLIGTFCIVNAVDYAIHIKKKSI